MIKLTRQLIEDRRRHVQRVIQERPEEPHRRQLQCEPKPVRVPPTLADELPIFIVEEEEPLKLLARRVAVETAIRRHLLRGQETLLIFTLGHRHGRSTYATVTMIIASQQPAP